MDRKVVSFVRAVLFVLVVTPSIGYVIFRTASAAAQSGNQVYEKGGTSFVLTVKNLKWSTDGHVDFTGSIHGIKRIPRTPQLDKVFSEKKIAETGWQIQKCCYVKDVGLKYATIKVGSLEAKANENGTFVFQDVPTGNHEVSVFDREGNLLFNTTLELVKEKDTLVKEVTSPELLPACCAHKNGITSTITAAEPCRDYNGPFGNCVDNNSLINFISSDCDRALLEGYCWAEHMPGISCYHPETGTNCSPLVGCPSYHHCH